MELIGYFLAVFMGVVLGLLGGGGSILTVPILVYFFNINATSSTGYSLFIVGLSALFGAYKYYKLGQLNFKVGTLFAIPSIFGVFIARRWIVPALPDPMFQLNDILISKDSFILIFFALIMLLASFSMIKKNKNFKPLNSSYKNIIIPIEGIVVGLITGFVGAGGGFLIIPALVILAKLPMKEAVGTSLAIISVKSLIGFIGDVQTNPDIDWNFLFIFSGLSVIGILLGTYFSSKVSNEKLKPIFGYFVLLMGLVILLQNV